MRVSYTTLDNTSLTGEYHHADPSCVPSWIAATEMPHIFDSLTTKSSLRCSRSAWVGVVTHYRYIGALAHYRYWPCVPLLRTRRSQPVHSVDRCIIAQSCNREDPYPPKHRACTHYAGHRLVRANTSPVVSLCTKLTGHRFARPRCVKLLLG